MQPDEDTYFEGNYYCSTLAALWESLEEEKIDQRDRIQSWIDEVSAELEPNVLAEMVLVYPYQRVTLHLRLDPKVEQQAGQEQLFKTFGGL